LIRGQKIDAFPQSHASQEADGQYKRASAKLRLAHGRYEQHQTVAANFARSGVTRQTLNRISGKMARIVRIEKVLAR
jgi:hypothetical protein